MFEFHADKKKYFEINLANAEKHILPFIEKSVPVKTGMRVLDIGCGEGGVLKAFLKMGCTGVGVELDNSRLEDAAFFLSEEMSTGKVRFISRNIYDIDVEKDLEGRFDIILLKDVIEHIHDQKKFLGVLKNFMAPGAFVFFGFPPWHMPMGGHQQVLKNKWLSKIPYYHLLPMPVYKSILKHYGENVQEMVEIKETGISIERFERIADNTGYHISGKKHYLLNPIYEYKFGWKPREQLQIISSIPFVRNFFTTCVYYLLKIK